MNKSLSKVWGCNKCWNPDTTFTKAGKTCKKAQFLCRLHLHITPIMSNELSQILRRLSIFISGILRWRSGRQSSSWRGHRKCKEVRRNVLFVSILVVESSGRVVKMHNFCRDFTEPQGKCDKSARLIKLSNRKHITPMRQSPGQSLVQISFLHFKKCQ